MTPQKWKTEKKLNPGNFLRMTIRMKEMRQKVIITYNPSEINQNQLLLVRFPNLGSDEVIITTTVNLSFNIELSSMADPKRVLVTSIGRPIVTKLAVKFEWNEILGVDDSDFLDATETC